ncbi:MAG: hypothetical protein ACFE8L_02220 [Candidatus Hodarchaeota archaeon]
MSDNNSEDYFLSIKDIINESLLRDLSIFFLLFILVVAQLWDNILLLLFPIVTFTFSLFFRTININKWRIEFRNEPVIYNPLGLEKKHANRLAFSTFIQLILLYWLGAESLYNPHIVDNYFIYFKIFFIFIYSFGFFWIFTDLWKFSKIEIDIKLNKDTTQSTDLNSVLSYLKIRIVKLISLIVILNLLILNIINLLSVTLIENDLIPSIDYYLPGTGSEGSEPITISFITYIILIVSPTLSAICLLFTYRNINYINTDRLNEILKPLPKKMQIIIIENLKALSNNIKDQLKIE